MANKQNVVEQVAGLTVTDNLIPVPTKKAGRPKRKAVSSVPIQRTCKECGASYAANNVTFDDKTTLITPPRCEMCQTAHVTNGRVNKQILGFKHLGNLKGRLTAEQREAIISVLGNELKVLMDVYAGNSVSVSGFDLKNI